MLLIRNLSVSLKRIRKTLFLALPTHVGIMKAGKNSDSTIETNNKRVAAIDLVPLMNHVEYFIAPWYENVVESSKLRTSDADMFNLVKMEKF